MQCSLDIGLQDTAVGASAADLREINAAVAGQAPGCRDYLDSGSACTIRCRSDLGGCSGRRGGSSRRRSGWRQFLARLGDDAQHAADGHDLPLLRHDAAEDARSGGLKLCLQLGRLHLDDGLALLDGVALLF